ncbi:MAG: DegT/DnrJ/EryC1/StrS family aminotransferase, partial [Deltaproteobacteria bacterium]|nr:DegT/DnrJ/EryC1/StrS family aminotransferase [Deltaproteobacteria bacterium]
RLLAPGEGGIIAARDPAVLAATRRYRNQGAESPAGNRFDHEGFNLRPTDVLSALGVARMDGIDARTASLRRVHRTCREAFSDLRRLRLFDVDEAAGELPLWVEAIAADRDRVIAGLAARGIEAKPYPPALCDCAHLRCPAPLPRSRFFADHGIVLPSGPDQPDEDLARVALALREIDRQDGGRMPEAP